MLRHEVEFKSIFLRVLEVHRGAQGRAAEVEGKGVGTRGWVTGRGYMWTRGCSLLPHFPQSSSAFNLLFLWATFDYLRQGFGPIDSSRWHKPGMWAGLRWWVMVRGAEPRQTGGPCFCSVLPAAVKQHCRPRVARSLLVLWNEARNSDFSMDLSTCSCYN